MKTICVLHQDGWDALVIGQLVYGSPVLDFAKA
jgi:hypothetical protein